MKPFLVVALLAFYVLLAITVVAVSGIVVGIAFLINSAFFILTIIPLAGKFEIPLDQLVLMCLVWLIILLAGAKVNNLILSNILAMIYTYIASKAFVY
jgi:hypothetical protein